MVMHKAFLGFILGTEEKGMKEGRKGEREGEREKGREGGRGVEIKGRS